MGHPDVKAGEPSWRRERQRRNVPNPPGRRQWEAAASKSMLQWPEARPGFRGWGAQGQNQSWTWRYRFGRSLEHLLGSSTPSSCVPPKPTLQGSLFVRFGIDIATVLLEISYLVASMALLLSHTLAASMILSNL